MVPPSPTPTVVAVVAGVAVAVITKRRRLVGVSVPAPMALVTSATATALVTPVTLVAAVALVAAVCGFRPPSHRPGIATSSVVVTHSQRRIAKRSTTGVHVASSGHVAVAHGRPSMIAYHIWRHHRLLALQ